MSALSLREETTLLLFRLRAGMRATSELVPVYDGYVPAEWKGVSLWAAIPLELQERKAVLPKRVVVREMRDALLPNFLFGAPQ